MMKGPDKKNTAVFLDRDGTINEEAGYMDSFDKLSILPPSFEAIRLINRSGMKAVVITNQAGVAKGLFSEEHVWEIHERIQSELRERGAHIDRFYYCPHHPTEGQGKYLQVCDCRKPAAGMLIRAAEEMNIDLGRSYLVGDMVKDMEAAHRAGVKAVLVRTGHGGNVLSDELTLDDTAPDYIADDILDAVGWIMKDRRP
ncbi:MAG: D-glycero-beta-D-manno-heptose 1,7-bisphosphate 7-phosphatase [Deltaproteobacteria bacterium]|nr:D-glycero-beta-D-manno-heptose 1,7-bisphosphate 7-phosphatase [Deltaproteobacteria bacterium]